jgi:hypothetical protein
VLQIAGAEPGLALVTPEQAQEALRGRAVIQGTKSLRSFRLEEFDGTTWKNKDISLTLPTASVRSVKAEE